jgi:deoxyribose-phosphate aldolase
VCPATTERVLLEGAVRVGSAPQGRALAPRLAARIDHTLLRADATGEEIDRLCDEALRYGFASVCVNGAWVRHAAERLRGRGVVCAVVGFPLGANLPETKAAEAAGAVRDGAGEIDVVLNVGALRSRDHALVARDLAGVVVAAGVPVKVILETGLLTREEKVEACVLAQAAGAAFVKTSTGFGPSGATVEDVRLMRETVGPGVSVKASGGVRNVDVAQAMVEAGADRIGASASVAIVGGATA